MQPDVPISAGYSREGFFNTMDVFRLNERIALSFQVTRSMLRRVRDMSQDNIEALLNFYALERTEQAD